MSWSLRRVVVVLTAVAALGCAACLHSAFAQLQAVKTIALPIAPVQPPTTGSADAASFDLPKDTQARRSIEAALDYINAKRWPEVVEALQRILDDPQDKFAPLPRKGPDGKEVIVPTSVRAEANRLLANLPAAGLEAYKTFSKAGPKADEYLKKAKDAATTEERLALLGLVVRRYLHTDAGGEAADLLATHYMDRGDFRTASRYFSLLMTRAGGADSLSPETLFRAAYAFHQADDKGGEDSIWQTARARGIREVHFGDEAKSVTELKDYLGGLGRAVDVVGRQWAYFLGDASHTGKGEGGPAFMGPTNLVQRTDVPSGTTNSNGSSHTETFDTKLRNLFKTAADHLARVNQPVMPSQFPVAAMVALKANKGGGQKIPLVVYRTYAGIVAVNMETGKIDGYSTISGGLDWFMQDSNRETVLNQWNAMYMGNPAQGQPAQRPGIVFENTTIGTLSTDGEFAYTIGDLAVPPPAAYAQQMGFPGNPNPNMGWSPEIVKALSHSRLMAYDLTRGCASAWNVPADNEKGEFADCYFLGPPLCLNGKLYVLSEKQQELRLICMENVRNGAGWTPKIDFVLSLGTARDNQMQQDPLRRIHAAHLSYGEGVLVCPTNLGYVIGIDLLQDSLLWAYPYRDKTDAPEDTGMVMGPGGMPWRGGRFPGGMNPNGTFNQAPPQSGWKVSAPIIQDGKVVFTAPDSKSLHCVNLKDGTPAWSRPRQENDLYLGGVVNGKVIVVGTKTAHAYTLAKGDDAWTVETGLPSGFGAASDNTYYLPLQKSIATKEPEICAIDVDRGIVTGHTKARAVEGKEIKAPGNLLFFNDEIVSQTTDEVVAYPQLKIKIAEMTEALKANPNDPKGLFDRGELSLEEGNLEGAVQDFRQVLRNNPPADLVGNVRNKLYDALTEDFQHNFDKAEKYEEDYAALCSLDLPAGATESQRAEARRRRTNFLYLIAKGKEGQRKLTEAFDKYLELNGEAQQDELLSLVDERLVKAAPDVLAQGRIAAMVAGATEVERKPLEARIASRWKEIESRDDPAELRKFVTLFGSLFAVGQEARLHLAERLMDDDKDPNALIDAERQLSLLRARTRDPEVAARAVESLARLNTRKGLLEDAAYYYRVLRDRYPTVKVRDGKTGADVFNEMATDKRLWSHLDAPPPFGAAGKLKATAEPENSQLRNQTFKFSHDGENLPFFQRYSLGIQFGAGSNNEQIKLVDRTTGEPYWKAAISVPNTMFQTVFMNNNMYMQVNRGFRGGFPGAVGVSSQPPPAPHFAFMNLGHLVVLPVGHMVFGIDAATGRKLWTKDLINGANGPDAAQPNGGRGQFAQVTVDPRDGSIQVLYADGWTQQLGQTGPLEGAAVCLQTKDSLTAVDPISGRVLWTRSDVSSHSRIFGDDQHVFVVEMSSDLKSVPVSTRVFRLYDGATVKAPDFHHLYDSERRIRLVGRDILVADKDKDATTLRLYDPLTGKDVWKQAFAPKSHVLRTEGGDLAGVVEPNGQVRVIDLNTRKEVLNANSKMDPKYLEKDATLTVLGDASHVYVVCDGPVEAGVHVNTNLLPGTGLRGLNVNGQIYAFSSATGKKHWEVSAPATQLVLDQFQEMPMLLLTAQTMKQEPTGQMTQNSSLRVIEKRTGKLLGPIPNLTNQQFHTLEVDARNGKIEFISPMEKITIALDNDKPTASAPAP
jgi:outer membrane protein assembly factor BamB/tetratricopeptide (TPR) repeat protein